MRLWHGDIFLRNQAVGLSSNKIPIKRFVIFPANEIVIDSIRAYVSDEDLNKSYLINMPVNDILRSMRATDDVIDVI